MYSFCIWLTVKHTVSILLWSESSTARLTHAISSKHSTLSSVTLHHLLNSQWLCHFIHKTSSSQFSAPHMQEVKPTTYIAKTSFFAFCPLTEAEVSKLLLSSHPTTCSSWSNPFTASPSYLFFTLNSTHTHLSLQAPSPMHSIRLG